MLRLIRIEFSNVHCHLTLHGKTRQDIYLKITESKVFIDYLKWDCVRHQ